MGSAVHLICSMTQSPQTTSSTVEQPQHSPLQVSASLGFNAVLTHYGISVLVSTYQAGKLMVLRAGQPKLNIHFRNFKDAMGLAANRMRLAIGTASEICELYNMPALARKLEPIGRHDACYLPRNTHVTGDIDIHEMVWAGPDLWFVNTRFSCLCTLDVAYSFIPRWRPPFVSALTPDDRCHLNGVALLNHRPRYVTMLGATDTAQGWRENKAQGGLLMDIDTNEVIAEGLSMPHSPRWYRDRLWIQESGLGRLATVDLISGELHTVAEFPGFTRGLDFYQDLAFVGLSQVREKAVFSDIPLTQRLAERVCGVWVVNLMTGETVGSLKFDSGVQEIFSVQVLPGIRFPEILPEDEKLVATSYALPDEALVDVPGGDR